MRASIRPFLTRYEKRLRGAGWAFGDQAVVSTGNFVTMILLARYMDVAAFGIFILTYAGLRLTTSLQHAAITEPHNSLGAKREGIDYRRFTSVIGIAQIAFALGWFLLLGAAGGVVYALGYTDPGVSMVVLGATLVPWMGQEFVRRVLYTRHQSRAAFFNDVLSYGAQAGLVILFVHLYGQPTVLHALAAYGLSSLAASTYGMWQIRSHLVFERSVFEGEFLRETLAQVWKFAKWLTGSNMVKWFGDHGHVWLIGAMLGAAPLGAYKAANQLANVLNPYQQAVAAYLPSVASTIMAREGTRGLRKLLRRMILWLALPYVLFAAAVMWLARPLLELAYGDKFLDQGLEWVIVLIAFAYVLSFGKAMLRIVFVAMEESRPLFVSSIISVVLLATSGVALIYFLGIQGAPISHSVMSVVAIAYFWVVYRRIAHTPPLPRTAPAAETVV